MKIIFSLSILLTVSLSSFSQSEKDTTRKQELIYYYVGEGCPAIFINHPERKHGFIVKCVGCFETEEIEINNKRVIKEIDKKKGEGWTASYLKSMINDGKYLDNKAR